MLSLWCQRSINFSEVVWNVVSARCSSLLVVVVFPAKGGGEVRVTVGSVDVFSQLQPSDSSPHSIPF